MLVSPEIDQPITPLVPATPMAYRDLASNVSSGLLPSILPLSSNLSSPELDAFKESDAISRR